MTMNNGFIRVAAVAPETRVADVTFNVEAIKRISTELASKGVRAATFPELCISGYTCADLLHQSLLLDSVESGLDALREFSAECPVMLVVGAPIRHNNSLYNCSVIIGNGEFYGVVPKTYIPDYNEFYEKRWFNSPSDADTISVIEIGSQFVNFGTNYLFELDGVRFGIEVCEDLWVTIPPSSYASLAGADIILNLSASNDLIGKYAYLKSLISQQSARCMAGYVYASAGFGESTTDLVFDGKAIIAENGTILASNNRWTRHESYSIADIDIMAIRRDRMHIRSFADCQKHIDSAYTVEIVDIPATTTTDSSLLRNVTRLPFVPAEGHLVDERCEEIVNIQISGLAQRLNATHTKSLVIGISGGLDSTLALLVATRTFDALGLDRCGILGVTMPGFGTTDRTHDNAVSLMNTLGVSSREISIVPAVNQHFYDIGHDSSVKDVTYENSQARERTQLLMDIANQTGGMVLGTGDLSELALGWATYNGDHMSMYGVNAGVPKTLVKYLVRWFASNTTNDEERHTLLDIVDTPISPELIPAEKDGTIKQKTEDLVGPYELHDFFLYYMLRYGFSPRRIYLLARKAFDGVYGEEIIKHWLKTFFRRFFNQQFKRSCMPDGPKVGSVCLSPRGDWRMPSDASSALWMKECEEL